MDESTLSRFVVLADGLLTDKQAHEMSAWHAAMGFVEDPTAIEVNWLAIRVGHALGEADRPCEPAMSSGRFGILRDLYIADGNRLSMTELGQRLSVALAYISKLVDGLVSSGLVERVDDTEDKRKTWAQLTPSGLTLVAELLPALTSRVETTWSGLSPREKKLLVHLLSKVRLNLQLERASEKFIASEDAASILRPKTPSLAAS